MENDGFVYVPIPNELYQQIEKWRLELCETYSLSDMSNDAFISFLLNRSNVDVSILLWHLQEGLDAFKDYRRHNDN